MGLKKQTTGKFPWIYRCQICGQYIGANEDIYLVYPDGNPKIEFGVVHSSEMDNLNLTSDEQILFLENRKIPRFKGWSQEQLDNAKIFEDICRNKGFKIKTMSKRTMKLRKPKTSFTIEYDMLTRNLSYDYKGRQGLFDGLIFNQILTTIENEFQKQIGETPCEIITAQSVINKAIEDTNKIMGVK